jgi:molecular chaperone GrpE (heat shock protein)
MEQAFTELLKQFGIPSAMGAILFFVIRKTIDKIQKHQEEMEKLQERATEERKAARDFEIKILSQSISSLKDDLIKHKSHHVDFEKNMFDKIDKVYERLNPIGDSVYKIQGYMEAQQSRRQQ